MGSLIKIYFKGQKLLVQREIIRIELCIFTFARECISGYSSVVSAPFSPIFSYLPIFYCINASLWKMSFDSINEWNSNFLYLIGLKWLAPYIYVFLFLVQCLFTPTKLIRVFLRILHYYQTFQQNNHTEHFLFVLLNKSFVICDSTFLWCNKIIILLRQRVCNIISILFWFVNICRKCDRLKFYYILLYSFILC